MDSGVILVIVVATALAFDFTNGFHDTANAVATSISTRALAPRTAVTMAAILNFAGAFISLEVAATVAGGIVDAGVVSTTVIFGGLIGAIFWNLLTWYFGLPSSSSHALIGGLMGAGIAFALTDGNEYLTGQPGATYVDDACLVNGQPAADAGACGVVRWDVILDKILIPMIASPLFGFCAAALLMIAIMWLFRRGNPHKLNRGFRLAQTVSAAAMALGHGLQDAQKTMGVIFLALLTGGYVASGDPLPTWVIFAAAGAISLGTYSGGWRIMRTLGRRIIHLDPARGFASETIAAGVLYTTAYAFEAPISTTHTITSAVMGAGATKRFSAVRWGVARSIVTAWVLTFPMAGLAAAACYWISHLLLEVIP